MIKMEVAKFESDECPGNIECCETEAKRGPIVKNLGDLEEIIGILGKTISDLRKKVEPIRNSSPKQEKSGDSGKELISGSMIYTIIKNDSITLRRYNSEIRGLIEEIEL